MKNMIAAILCTVLIGLLSFLNYSKSKEIKALKNSCMVATPPQPISQELDSLKTELFNAQTTVTRYEISLDMLKEENPKAAAAFEKILGSKTE